MLPRSWTSSLIENRNFLWSCIFQYKEQFGLVYRAIFGHQSVIVILDPDFGRELVTKASKIFKKQQKLNKRFQLLMGDNVFTAVEHDVWRRHRTLLNPAFTDEKLSSTVAHATNKTVRELLHKINKNPTRNAGEDMSNLTIDIIGSAGFGFDFGATIRETLDSDSLAVKTQEFFEAFPSFFLAPSDFIRMNFKVGPLKTIHEVSILFKY
jgi:cytochrome P450